MSRTAKLALALVLAIGSLQSPLHADEYTVDPSHTSVIFGISHLGYSFTYGRFNKVSGAFTLDPAKPDAASFTLAIDAGSIDTNDAKRDDHLRGPDFLNTGEFPVISFKSNKVVVEKKDDATIYVVSGDLTMHGVTKPVTLNLQKLGEGPGPTGQGFHTGFNCQTKLNRSEWGMTKMVPHIGDEVAVTISLEGSRK
ncbi:YceI family protein [Lacipirellula sp.]|uniref:YceI family protein n=1 Tax=Lacipirellula sp. TaxID=2691419 RepID=UPI003D13A612